MMKSEKLTIQPRNRKLLILQTSVLSLVALVNTHGVFSAQGDRLPGRHEDRSNESQPQLSLEKQESSFPDLPKGITSFGAAIVNDQIVVIGGKSGKAHSYAKAYQNRDVWSLSLQNKNSQWSVIGENLGLQGLAVVADGQDVYRMGGLEARNEEGQSHDLHSCADFLQFSPLSGQWKALPSLPEGRSSMDACIAGNCIFVAGGWNMVAGQEPVWASDMLKFDLNDPQAQWESIQVPFRSRALAMTADENRLIVVGGIQLEGGTSSDVHFYDLQTGVWSTGPSIPSEDEMKAFGCAAVSVAGHALVSTYDGGVFTLTADSSSWVKVHQFKEGRFFHRLLPLGGAKFVMLGGSHMEHGSPLQIEIYEVIESSSVDASK